MAGRFKDCLRRLRKRGVGEAANSDGDRCRLPRRIPEYRRTARSAEVMHDSKSAVGHSGEVAGLADDLGVTDLVKCSDAKGAARPALAFQTVAQRDLGRLAAAFDLQLAAAAACCSVQHGSSTADRKHPSPAQRRDLTPVMPGRGSLLRPQPRSARASSTVEDPFSATGQARSALGCRLLRGRAIQGQPARIVPASLAGSRDLG